MAPATQCHNLCSGHDTQSAKCEQLTTLSSSCVLARGVQHSHSDLRSAVMHGHCGVLLKQLCITLTTCAAAARVSLAEPELVAHTLYKNMLDLMHDVI
jgi:hypothetical protein